jgi:hypothetical protein
VGALVLKERPDKEIRPFANGVSDEETRRDQAVEARRHVEVVVRRDLDFQAGGPIF